MMGFERFVVTIKSKLKGLKTGGSSSKYNNHKAASANYYDKIDKSESMRIEISSRKAQKLIQKTLKIADSPRHRTYAF
ncbi:hypothetical protein MKW94_020174 [Papaver nudicaule]|uniref:Uncharacterized protein n=1 Tax=Papaver nudicaule TaxID=74823 RepID=A0AA41VSZ5_PAPNU|nr:hypothetical protein [Papaver nudicaule]